MVEESVGIDRAVDLEGVVVDEDRFADGLGNGFRRRGVKCGGAFGVRSQESESGVGRTVVGSCKRHRFGQ